VTRETGHAVPELRERAYDAADAALLVEQANALNEQLYGHADQTPLDAAEFAAEARGHFVVAYLDGQPAGCGGYRRHTDDPTGRTAEIKRMYVRADARRAGLGRALLAALEESARRDGYTQIILDVGAKQHAAHSLYEAGGYHRIPGFSIYHDRPGNRSYAKSLSSPP
jgi:GNAT superfamily N-acetyltransferase